MKEISINQNSSTERVKFGPVGRDIILNEKIEDETARAIAKETQLEAAIATAGAVKDVKCDGTSIVVSKVADIGPSIDTKVQVETTRATTAEGTLQTNINTEATRAQGAETTLTNNLATEVTNRTNADTTLQTNIDNEATARQNADTAESTTRQSADANLQEQVNNLKARGRYLSLWNSTTGLPADMPVPTEYPYTYAYKAGDYYIIGTVGSGQSLLQPSGTQITKESAEAEWVIPSISETREVTINDVYYFDGTNWAFQSNAQKEVSFSGLAGHPTDNEELSQILTTAEQAILSIAGTLVEKADKDEVVKLTGAQTIQGTKTFQDGVVVQGSANFTVDIKPTNTYYYNLGSDAYRWTELYAKRLNIKASSAAAEDNPKLIFKRYGSSFEHEIALTGDNQLTTNCSLLPTQGSTILDLGSTTNAWNNIYFKKELNANGSAGTAGQVLTSNGAEAAPTWQDAPAPSNMVTTDTAQTISGIKTFSKPIEFSTGTFSATDSYPGFKFTYTSSGGTYVTELKPTAIDDSGQYRSIGKLTWQWPGDLNPHIANSSYMQYDFLGTDNKRWGGIYAMSGDFSKNISPATTTTSSNGTVGTSTKRWKAVYTGDINASGNITDGTNSTTVADITVKSTESTETTGQLKIAVVTALPASPDPNTLYFIKEA